LLRPPSSDKWSDSGQDLQENFGRKFCEIHSLAVLLVVPFERDKKQSQRPEAIAPWALLQAIGSL
jgi:hypothetical protein